MSFQVLFPAPNAQGGISGTSNPLKTSPVPRQGQLSLGLVSIQPIGKTPKAVAERGCNVCPLDKVKGIVKIKGIITGKEVLVFAQSPGPKENLQGRELLGPAGKWWWKELFDNTGLSRKDVDIQNSVRCFPADRVKGDYGVYLKMRNPSAEEIRCCSIYTEEALEKSKAKYVLILGLVAAKAVLGLKKAPTTKIFYSDKLKAKVYLLDHPAFFIRGYGKGPKLEQFRSTLKQLKSDMTGGQDLSDRFAFLRKQDYRAVIKHDDAMKAAEVIRAAADKGLRAAVDIEDDVIDGKRCVVCCGFSVKPGQSFVFVINHPDQSETDSADVRQWLSVLLEDPKVKKALQFGCSDVAKLWQTEHIRVRGWTHDTMLSEYLRFSDRKAYGLVATYTARFPQFSGYEMVVTDDMLQGVTLPPKIAAGSIEDRYKYLESNRLFKITKLSLDTLRLYNGGDCHLTKLIEISNKKHVSAALMRLYIDLSRLLYKMEPRGPLYDFEHSAKLIKIYPSRTRYYRRKLIKLLGNKKLIIEKTNKKGLHVKREIEPSDFNPGSPEQVKAALIATCGIGLGKLSDFNTGEETLLLLGRRFEFPKVMIQFRGSARAASTLQSYEACARANKNRLRTKWHAAGARTGRLRSGGSIRKEDKIVNLQNIKRDPHVQNLCIADPDWRVFYEAAAKLLKPYENLEKYWKLLVAWEALKPDIRKKARKPEPSGSAKLELSAYAAELEVWVKVNLPDLKVYLALDYGQVEVRVMAQMSGDKNLLKDCMESDIHTRVGVTMTGWDADRIQNDEETRTLTKNVHFGIMFGLNAKGLYEFVKAMSPVDMRDRITQEQIDEAVHNYFKRYPKVKHFHNIQRAFALEYGYVETLFGMKQVLNVSDNQHDEQTEVYEAEDGERSSYWGNQAINGPVQGTAHQLMICALVNLLRKREEYAVLGIPPLEVHDALYMVLRLFDLPEGAKKAKYLLEQESIRTSQKEFGIKWRIPIVTEAKAGLRLGCKVKIKEDIKIGEFLANWFYLCRKQETELETDFAKVVAEALVKG